MTGGLRKYLVMIRKTLLCRYGVDGAVRFLVLVSALQSVFMRYRSNVRAYLMLLGALVASSFKIVDGFKKLYGHVVISVCFNVALEYYENGQFTINFNCSRLCFMKAVIEVISSSYTCIIVLSTRQTIDTRRAGQVCMCGKVGVAVQRA